MLKPKQINQCAELLNELSKCFYEDRQSAMLQYRLVMISYQYYLHEAIIDSITSDIYDKQLK